ncbi:MAG: hypothetical protein IJW82_00040 [Clostridia bacterium]|nr:hypothetical protein [Clostridia bacterium]
MEMNALQEFYQNGKSLPILREGKYDVVLKSTAYVANETNPNNSYIKVILETNEGRQISTNKFNRGFQIMIAHLKKQLGREDKEVVVQEFLNELINNKTPLNIWVTIYTDPNTKRSNTNINFLEPLDEQEVAVVDDEPM